TRDRTVTVLVACTVPRPLRMTGNDFDCTIAVCTGAAAAALAAGCFLAAKPGTLAAKPGTLAAKPDTLSAKPGTSYQAHAAARTPRVTRHITANRLRPLLSGCRASTIVSHP